LGIPPDLFWPAAFVISGVYLYRKKFDSNGYIVTQKKFYRVRSFSRFMGVCSGLAVYLDADSNLIRMAWIVFSFVTLGLGIIIYFIIVFMVPYYNES
jgi:phage shock protein PspC (stress-responsive transcriptional regulator)